MLGGGMRQAGVLAAAGIVALRTMTQRLEEDHRRARALAEGIQANRHVRLGMGMPATNMVFFDLGPDVAKSTAQVENEMKAVGILLHASGPRQFRLVTHYWISDDGVLRTVDALKSILS